MRGWPEFRRRAAGTPAWAQDAAIALVLVAVEVSLLWFGGAGALSGASPDQGLLALALVLASSVPLVWRRRAPVGVLVMTLAAVTLKRLAGAPVHTFGMLVALFSVAALAPRARSWAALGGTILVTTTAVLLMGGPRLLPINVVVVVTAWVLGDRQRVRRAYIAELEQRAAQLEREREDRARLAVAEERARIARDLHDVVAHSVSLMVVQATAAHRTLHTAPAQAQEALETVARTGRSSLVELRRLLGVLRHPDDEALLRPQPGMAGLDDLVAHFAAAGLPVDLTVDGQVCALPSTVDVSAYRIVQEALTNALKHAGADRVEVRVAYASHQLHLAVSDDGAGAAADVEPGHGILGMVERAALVGGTLVARTRAAGGFEVLATMPVVRQDEARCGAVESGERTLGERVGGQS